MPRRLMVALVAALGLVATGAGNGISGDLAEDGRAIDWALLVVAALVVVAIVAAIGRRGVALTPVSSERMRLGLPREVLIFQIVPHLVTIFVLLVLALLIGLIPDEDALRGIAAPPTAAPAITASTVNESNATVGSDPDDTADAADEPLGEFGLPIVVLAAALAAIATVALLRAARHSPPAGDSTMADGSALAEALAASEADLDDLAGDLDHRRVVIRAYARMEWALAAEGLAREKAEAPFEYLERTLAAMGVAGGDARRLTELFERARFSQGPIGPDVRAEAVRAVEAIRRALRRVPA